jgi:hypothetical protein
LLMARAPFFSATSGTIKRPHSQKFQFKNNPNCQALISLQLCYELSQLSHAVEVVCKSPGGIHVVGKITYCRRTFNNANRTTGTIPTFTSGCWLWCAPPPPPSPSTSRRNGAHMGNMSDGMPLGTRPDRTAATATALRRKCLTCHAKFQLVTIFFRLIRRRSIELGPSSVCHMSFSDPLELRCISQT